MFVSVEKSTSKHYINTVFSPALKRSLLQKPRVSGIQKLLAGWWWRRNLFNGKWGSELPEVNRHRRGKEPMTQRGYVRYTLKAWLPVGVAVSQRNVAVPGSSEEQEKLVRKSQEKGQHWRPAARQWAWVADGEEDGPDWRYAALCCGAGGGGHGAPAAALLALGSLDKQTLQKAQARGTLSS